MTSTAPRHSLRRIAFAIALAYALVFQAFVGSYAAALAGPGSSLSALCVPGQDRGGEDSSPQAPASHGQCCILCAAPAVGFAPDTFETVAPFRAETVAVYAARGGRFSLTPPALPFSARAPPAA